MSHWGLGALISNWKRLSEVKSFCYLNVLLWFNILNFALDVCDKNYVLRLENASSCLLDTHLINHGLILPLLLPVTSLVLQVIILVRVSLSKRRNFFKCYCSNLSLFQSCLLYTRENARRYVLVSLPYESVSKLL
jgi:hypothetical protein